MQQFIYRLLPTRPEMLSLGPTADEEAVVGAHFSYLEALTERGVVLLAGRTLKTGAQTFGIVVFAAESEKDALVIMGKDPAVEQKVMKAELFSFGVALLSRDWIGSPGNEGRDRGDTVSPLVK